MAENSGIEWTDATWNPLAGCTEVSPGCTNCYAAVMAHRLEAMGQAKCAGTTRKAASGKVVWTGKVNLDETALLVPLQRKKPTRYFVNSMSDLFHEDVPFEFVARVWKVMNVASQHTYQILTKRPERMRAFYLEYLGNWKALNSWSFIQPGIWLGVSVEDRLRKARIDILRDVQASVRFLSVEPLLEDLGAIDLAGIRWIIVGGESGHGARPMNLQWAVDIVSQCQAAGVPVFVKQMGSNPVAMGEAEGRTGIDLYPIHYQDRKGGDPDEWWESLRVRQFPEPAHV